MNGKGGGIHTDCSECLFSVMNVNTALRHAAVLLALIAAAGIFVFFHNCFSPGYTLHGNPDPSCFYMDGKALAHGYIPYVDIIDVKGPILYFFYALGYLIGGTHGVAVLFVITHAFTLVAYYRIAELYISNKGFCLLAALMPLLLMLCPAVDCCGRAEEIVLPFIAWSTYFSLCYIKNQENRRSLCTASFFLGISGATAFLVKYNIALPLFAVWVYLFFCSCSRKHNQGWLCFGSCTIGFLCVVLPNLAYLLCTDSLIAFFDVYFRLNMETYTLNTYPVYNKILSFFFRCVAFPACILCLFIKPFKKEAGKSGASDRALLLMLSVCVILSCIGGREYYYIITTPFCLYLAIALFYPIAKVYPNFRCRYALVLTPLIVVSFLSLTKDAERTLKNLVQGRSEKFSELDRIIDKHHKPKVLYLNFLDCGLGVNCDALPACAAWAHLVGAPDYFDKMQRDAIESGKADFVITRPGRDTTLFMDDNDGTSIMQKDWLKKNHYVFRHGQAGLNLYQRESE